MNHQLEEALGRANSKTLTMRQTHIFLELEAYIRDIRANGRLMGKLTKTYYNFFATSLEQKLKEIKEGLPQINYLDIDNKV